MKPKQRKLLKKIPLAAALLLSFGFGLGHADGPPAGFEFPPAVTSPPVRAVSAVDKAASEKVLADIAADSSAPPAASYNAPLSSVDGFIEPERTSLASISFRDINRIVCPVPVADVFFSKEKPVSVTNAGTNVYVKLKKRIQGDRESYVTTPVDLHIVCGDQVYTMILQPRDIDSVTLRLGNPLKSKAASMAKEWGALPDEEKVRRLTTMVYKDELPSAFNKAAVDDDSSRLRVWRNMTLRAVNRVSAPGLGLAAVEYEVLALEPLTLDERDFLDAGISKSIAGITVDPLVLESANQRARLIVVERSLSDGR